MGASYFDDFAKNELMTKPTDGVEMNISFIGNEIIYTRICAINRARNAFFEYCSDFIQTNLL